MLIVNLGLLVLAAVPVIVYFHRNGDKMLSSYLLVLAALFVFSGYSAVSGLAEQIGEGTSVGIGVAAYVLHWAVWIFAAVKSWSVRERLLPLATVFVLLVVYTALLGNLVTAILTALYATAAISIFQSARKQKAIGIVEDDDDAR